ncbi:MAG TPA: ThuA domain-containing protein [Bryobacteraceae bacterium]|nr:ThuA domain-containing protein [Bryobacteraceae bacterium]
MTFKTSLLLVLAWASLAQPKLSVLIVDGVNNHDWKTATRELNSILLATGRFRVDVSTSPPRDAAPEAWASWRPHFADYSAVLLNWNGGDKENGLRWPAEVENDLLRYVRSGGGLIIFHAANNAFLNWPEYNEMIGLGWRPKDFGPSLIISADGRVVTVPAGEGRNPGHGPRHDFQMAVLNPDHPITRGLPKHWLQPSEQLTHGQHGPAAGLTILTYAWSKDVNENEPMDWVRTYGQGRVYTTMLGHTWANEDNPNFRCKEFQVLIARGVEWAATGKVSLPTSAPSGGPAERIAGR